MKYRIVLTKDFQKQLNKLDKVVKENVTNWIIKYLYNVEDPRAYGKPLEGNLKGYWRYRIGDYRLMVKIVDKHAIVFAIKIGHRKDAYK